MSRRNRYDVTAIAALNVGAAIAFFELARLVGLWLYYSVLSRWL